MTKFQLKITIGILSVLLFIDFFFISSKNTLFKVPYGDIVVQPVKIAFEILYALTKAVVLGVWSFATGSWLGAAMTIGCVLLFILWILYKRKK